MVDIPKLSKMEAMKFEQLELKPPTNKDEAASIFNQFDTNGDGKISNEEIQAQGYIAEAIDEVKEFFKKFFGPVVENVRDEDGYFQYDTEKPETKIVKSLDELELRNGCCYDVRHCDITQLNISEEQLLDLTIDKTTIMTPEQKAILEPYMEAAKNPGLGIQKLHEQGFTGKGVKMAIIDQQLGRHEEYEDNIIEHNDINSEEMGWNAASMHGAAVTAIAVGKNTGVAPDAKVVYYSAVNMTNNPEEVKTYRKRIEQEIKANKDKPNYVKYLQDEMNQFNKMGAYSSNKPYVEAINKILDDNEKLPEKERVSVISISWGFDDLAPGYEELQQAIQRAKEQGVFIVSTALEKHYGMETDGANRNPKGDLDDPNNYEAGAYWKEVSENKPTEYKDKLLLVPMDHRTVADFKDKESFRYEGNDGGMSWSTPWLAGIYVLAKQADPNITPEKFWEYALSTSNECRNNDSGNYVGRIINPQELINKIQEQKAE